MNGLCSVSTRLAQTAMHRTGRFGLSDQLNRSSGLRQGTGDHGADGNFRGVPACAGSARWIMAFAKADDRALWFNKVTYSNESTQA